MPEIFNRRFQAAAGLIIAFVAIGSIAYFAVQSQASASPKPALPSAQSYATSVAHKTTDFQAAALADGVITQQEYDAAIQQTAECATKAGVDVEVTPAAGDRASSIGFTAKGTIGDAQAAKAKLDTCSAQYLDNVQTAWALQKAAATPAQVKQAHQRLTQCMTDGGAVIADGYFSPDDLNALMLKVSSPERTYADQLLFTRYGKCRSVVEEALGYTLP